SRLRPRRARLCPYPTLFRSIRRSEERHGVGDLLGTEETSEGDEVGEPLTELFLGHPGLLPHAGHRGVRHRGVDVGGADSVGGHTDRKSTRLNSSHVKISYAV